MTVASPRLNGAPSPPTRARIITSPLSTGRSSLCAGVVDRRESARDLVRGRLRERGHQPAPAGDLACSRALRRIRFHDQVVYVSRQLTSAAAMTL